jgi:hypothetical protein
MDWADYLRDQAAKYRQLAEQTDDPVIKNEMLELASVCERSPIISRTISQAGSAFARDVSAFVRKPLASDLTQRGCRRRPAEPFHQ